MRGRIVFLLFLTVVSTPVFAQIASNIVLDTNLVHFSKFISTDNLKKHLSVLTSNEFEGRYTGSNGGKKTVEYIAKQFKKLGLFASGDNGSFLQNYELLENATDIENSMIAVNRRKFKFLTDFYCFGRSSKPCDTTLNEIVFLGYGIDDPVYSDYTNNDLNLKGKTALIFAGEPLANDSTYLITKTKIKSGWSKQWRNKLSKAKEKGIENLLIVVDDINSEIENAKHQILSPAMGLKQVVNENNFPNTLYISHNLANEIIKGRKKLTLNAIKNNIFTTQKSVSFSIKTNIKLKVSKKNKTILAQNVVGFLEGSDLKNEFIIISAHNDHLGVDGNTIYYGADDDGSGTVAIMEIAQAFANAKSNGFAPKRSILFLSVSGEENGLLGSQFYADFAPIFPIKNTIANLNLDMLGRIDENYKTDSNYIYIIGSDKLSSELHTINEKANQLYTHLKLDYRYNVENEPNRFYYRSDHYNFAKNNIPVIFYFNGTHQDYHRPTDTIDKINFEALQKRTQLVFATAWHLANLDHRIVIDSHKK